MKEEREHWTHVGAEYRQVFPYNKILIGQPRYPAQLQFFPMSKERRSVPKSLLDTNEKVDYRTSNGGLSWFRR